MDLSVVDDNKIQLCKEIAFVQSLQINDLRMIKQYQSKGFAAKTMKITRTLYCKNVLLLFPFTKITF